MKTGLTSITFRQLDRGEIIDLVAKAGLDGIEWGGDIHVPHGDLDAAVSAARCTRDAGLEVSSYGSYYRTGVSEQEGLSFESVLETAKAMCLPSGVKLSPESQRSPDVTCCT